ncbi:hypothetical protein ACFL24_01295 [Patescibacteria group bacterium]
MQKIIKIVNLVMALALILGGVFYFAAPAEAAAEMHVKIEASMDGTHWYNYGGTEGGDSHLLEGEAGETYQFRIKVWNTGDTNAIDIEGLLFINDTSFIGDWEIIDTDLDNNGTHYLGIGGVGGAEGMLASVLLGTTEDTAESMLATVTLADIFPEGTSTIIVEVQMTYYDEEVIVFQENKITDETDLRSNFRITVDAEGSGEDELISTGTDLNNWMYILLLFFAVPVLFLALKIRNI